jgi:hypothetical protein
MGEVSGVRHGGIAAFLAAAAVGAVSAGLMVIIGTVIAVDALRTASENNLTPLLYLLFGGTLTGVLVAAATAWRLLEPIQSGYRRGGLTLVTVFATTVIMLVCIPVHQLVGRSGLVGLLVLAGITAVASWRRARRLVAET